MRLHALIVIAVAFQLAAAGQTTPSQAPVPSDPLELVTGSAQPVTDAAGRAGAINLLTHARAISNVRSQPYHMKSSFTSPDGAWQLDDESLGRGLYRWTAQGPSYAAINLNANQMHYSSQPGVAIPVRLAQVRSALFFMNTLPGARASLRNTESNINGMAVTCVLMERMFMGTPEPGGRRWTEQEFCIDPNTGLMMTYSPVPGLYIQYDYSAAVRFHNVTMPGKFTIWEAGQPVIQAKIESVTDPVSGDAELFQPTGLSEVGAGPPMMAPVYVRMGMGRRAKSSGATIVPAATVHGMMSPDGKISDLEVLASSDPSLSHAAVQRAADSHLWSDQVQSGATPQSYEIYFTIEFQGPLTPTE